MGFGIEGVSIGGTLVTYFLYSTIVIGYALSHYSKVLNIWVKYFLRLWSPFLYMVVALCLIEFGVNYFLSLQFQAETLLSVCSKLFLYLICCFPLIYLAIKELKIDLFAMTLTNLRSQDSIKKDYKNGH